jgi:hypothetical protein
MDIVTYRPSGTMCSQCLHRRKDCSNLPFHTMTPFKKDSDGVVVVRCNNYLKDK